MDHLHFIVPAFEAAPHHADEMFRAAQVFRRLRRQNQNGGLHTERRTITKECTSSTISHSEGCIWRNKPSTSFTGPFDTAGHHPGRRARHEKQPLRLAARIRATFASRT